MPEETTTETTSQTTSDATEKNTGEVAAGAGTQTAQQTTEARQEKTFTQEQVNKMIADRLPKAVKAELKKLTGEGDGTPTIEDLSKQLSEERTARQQLEARQSVRDYLMDPKHKLNVKPESVAAIEKLVMAEIVFGDDGKPSNLKEAVESVKSLAPVLFVNAPTSIDAGTGRNGQRVAKDMNSFIRQQAGYGN